MTQDGFEPETLGQAAAGIRSIDESLGFELSLERRKRARGC